MLNRMDDRYGGDAMFHTDMNTNELTLQMPMPTPEPTHPPSPSASSFPSPSPSSALPSSIPFPLFQQHHNDDRHPSLAHKSDSSDMLMRSSNDDHLHTMTDSNSLNVGQLPVSHPHQHHHDHLTLSPMFTPHLSSPFPLDTTDSSMTDAATSGVELPPLDTSRDESEQDTSHSSIEQEESAQRRSENSEQPGGSDSDDDSSSGSSSHDSSRRSSISESEPVQRHVDKPKKRKKRMEVSSPSSTASSASASSSNPHVLTIESRHLSDYEPGDDWISDPDSPLPGPPHVPPHIASECDNWSADTAWAIAFLRGRRRVRVGKGKYQYQYATRWAGRYRHWGWDLWTNEDELIDESGRTSQLIKDFEKALKERKARMAAKAAKASKGGSQKQKRKAMTTVKSGHDMDDGGADERDESEDQPLTKKPRPLDRQSSSSSTSSLPLSLSRQSSDSKKRKSTSEALSFPNR